LNTGLPIAVYVWYAAHSPSVWHCSLTAKSKLGASASVCAVVLECDRQVPSMAGGREKRVETDLIARGKRESGMVARLEPAQVFGLDARAALLNREIQAGRHDRPDVRRANIEPALFGVAVELVAEIGRHDF